MRRSKYSWLFAGTLAAGLGVAGCATNHGEDKEHEDKAEVKMTMDQLPPAVKATLTKEAGDGKIGDIDKETEEGKVDYEADVTIGGTPYEIKIAEDGSLLSKKVDKEDQSKDKEGDEKK